MVHRGRARAGVVLGVALLVLSTAARGQQTKEQTATLRVLLPQANTKLLIQDTATKQTGEVRNFVSPPLEAGKEFVYTLVATWAPNNYTTITRTRKVTVKPGKEVEADLREVDAAQPDKIVVRYVPTPQEVVDAMIKLAGVKKDEVVYDLGCGDGRIVITAVEKHGAKRGIGLDIDPERIKDSNENAKKAKVEDKLEFKMQDVLEIKDYSDANVVFLYMGNDLNLAVRPALQKTLKPGSRIVSHRFTMGDWQPDKTENITDNSGTKYQIHLWTIKE